VQPPEAVDRFLSGGEGALVRDHLRLVLARRQILAQGPRPLMEVLLDMALATAMISCFARCRAAAEGRTKVTPADVHEGISVAELRVLHHASPSNQGGLMVRLRRLVLTDRELFRQVLASEA